MCFNSRDSSMDPLRLKLSLRYSSRDPTIFNYCFLLIKYFCRLNDNKYAAKFFWECALNAYASRMPATILSFSYRLRLSCSIVFEDTCSDSFIVIPFEVDLQLSVWGYLQRLTHCHTFWDRLATHCLRVPLPILSLSYLLSSCCNSLFESTCTDSLIVIHFELVLQLSFEKKPARFTHCHTFWSHLAIQFLRIPPAVLSLS